MVRKGGGKSKSGGKSGTARGRASARGRERIKREEDSSQLLERGDTPSVDEVIDPEVDSPSEITSEGGGSEDDAPSYGDWSRHSTGSTSGARGQEGFSFPGEKTWGEAESRRERREEQRGSDRRVAQRRRPDDALSRELQEILTKDPELDATEIEVEVEGGAVTLSGTVDSSDARLLAEELVESVTGVREVHNNLKVTR